MRKEWIINPWVHQGWGRQIHRFGEMHERIPNRLQTKVRGFEKTREKWNASEKKRRKEKKVKKREERQGKKERNYIKKGTI